MTVDEVQTLVHLQSAEHAAVTNEHRILVAQVIVPPKKITVICRTVENGQLKDEELEVWLVGQESPTDGYKIVVQDDGKQFGLASAGFPNDKYLVLVGWYGDHLLSAFLAM